MKNKNLNLDTLSFLNLNDVLPDGPSVESYENLCQRFTWGDTDYVLVYADAVRECLCEQDAAEFVGISDDCLINIA
jgi:hypothetical protein